MCPLGVSVSMESKGVTCAEQVLDDRKNEPGHENCDFKRKKNLEFLYIYASATGMG